MDPRPIQVQRLFEKAPLTLFGSAALLAVTWVMLREQPGIKGEVTTFTAVMAALITARAGLFLAWYQNHDTRTAWGYAEAVAGFVIGLTWAWFCFHVFQLDDPFAVANTAMLMVGFIAGSIMTQAVFLPAYLCFAIPATVLPSIAVAAFDPGRLPLALFGFAYAGLATWFAVTISRIERDGILQMLENERLLTALREEKEKVEAATRQKSAFFAAASHDLRQPIHALSLYLGALAPVSHQRDVVGRMEAAIGSLQSLYDKVLDMSRLESGRIEVNTTSVDGRAILEKLLARHEAAAKEKSLVLSLEAEDATVLADPILLQRILDNLIGNAIKYTPAGHVRVSLTRSASHHIITVADTGIGIPAEIQGRVFDPYVQVDDREGGFGLGLSIVRSLAALQDIDVELTSEPGNGTRISLRLPAGRDAKRITASPFTLPVTTTDATIMILDDDADIREASRRLVESWGFGVLAPADWSTFLASRGDADCLVTDFQLWDNKTGFDAMADFGEAAIMVTGDTSDAVSDEAHRSGIVLLSKPLRPAQLRSAISRCLGGVRPASG